MKKNEVILHGEALVFTSEVPAGATHLKVEQPYFVVADSKTTGNHHVIDLSDGVEFLTLGDRRFMRNSKPTKIRCVHENRHDAIEIPPGSYEFDTQQEYDPFAQNLRNVRD